MSKQGKIQMIIGWISICMLMTYVGWCADSDRIKNLPITPSWIREYSPVHTSIREHVLTLPPCLVSWTFESAEFDNRRYEVAVCREFLGEHAISKKSVYGSLILSAYNKRVTSVAFVAKLSAVGEVRGSKPFKSCPHIIAANELSHCEGDDVYLLYNQDRFGDVSVMMFAENRQHIDPSWSLNYMKVRFQE